MEGLGREEAVGEGGGEGGAREAGEAVAGGGEGGAEGVGRGGRGEDVVDLQG